MKKFFASFLFAGVLTLVIDYLFKFAIGISSMELAGLIFVGVGLGAIYGAWIFYCTLHHKGESNPEHNMGIFFGILLGDTLYCSVFQGAPALNGLASLAIPAVLVFGSYFLAVKLRQRVAKKLRNTSGS